MKKNRPKVIKEIIQNIELLNPSEYTDIINTIMANKTKILTYDELTKQVDNLSLQEKLQLFQDLKIDIDNAQENLTTQLKSITDTKSKINGEAK